MYDNPRAALIDLRDGVVLERVAIRVLRHLGQPGLRLTGPTGDLNRDAYHRPWFGDRDETVVLVSTEDRWTDKLRKDIKDYYAMPAEERPEKAIFVTTRSTRQTDQNRLKKEVLDASGIELEIVDLTELEEQLETDALRRVAEYQLRVRARRPRPLRSVSEALERSGVPGAGAELVGRAEDAEKLRQLLDQTHRGRAPVLLVEGPAGIGKTRLAVEVADDAFLTMVMPPVAVAGEDLRDVPLDDRAVLIVDDAHRSPSLAVVGALLTDPTYDRVAVVLTARPGSSPRIRSALGLPAAIKLPTLSVGPLPDVDIDAIVLAHDLDIEGFRVHVRDLVNGNPLLAHVACETMLKQGTYTPADAAAILADLVTGRLDHVDHPPDQGRADQRRAATLAIAAFAGSPECTLDGLALLCSTNRMLPSVAT